MTRHLAFLLGALSLSLSALRALPDYLHGCLLAAAKRASDREREEAAEVVMGWVRTRKGGGKR